MEFGITNPKARDAFIRKVKAATCFDELPFMTKRMREEIENGMRWGEEHYRQNEAWD